MTADPRQRLYIIRARLNDGSTKETQFKTKRERRPGDVVNLPMDSDGTGKPGKGFLWRVSAIEQGDDPSIEGILVLDFERAHSDQE